MESTRDSMFKDIFGELTEDENNLSHKLANAYKAESQRLKLGRELKAAIKSQGLTQRELASIIRIQPADLSRILAGKSNLTIDVLSRITTELGLELTLKPIG